MEVDAEVSFLRHANCYDLVRLTMRMSGAPSYFSGASAPFTC